MSRFSIVSLLTATSKGASIFENCLTLKGIELADVIELFKKQIKEKKIPPTLD